MMKEIRYIKKWIGTAAIALFFCATPAAVRAQIYAPKLVCVNNLDNGDVRLEWETPNNTCGGAFNGYRIYASSDATKPFTLLAIATNPDTTVYIHTNANGNYATWYYYMTTDMNCFDEVALQSETLENNPPIVPELDFVSVTPEGDVSVNWLPSPSADAYSYIVYRDNGGFAVLDTVFGRYSTTFVDTTALPSIKNERYSIVARDKCGRRSLVSEYPQSTILLSGSLDPCERVIELSWTPYENWVAGVGTYQIWVRKNDEKPTLQKNLSGNVLNWSVGNISDGDDWCVTVYAVKNGTSTRAASNEFCIRADVVQPMSYIYLTNVSVNDQNVAETRWRWAANADLLSSEVRRGGHPDSVQTIESQIIKTKLSVENAFTDTTANTAGALNYYRVATTDSCGDQVVSNYAAPMLLKGKATQNYTNYLYWTRPHFEYGRLLDYQIYSTVGNTTALLASESVLTERYLDLVDLKNPAEHNICYFVETRIEMEYPDGTSEIVTSRSNTVCLQQSAKVVSPNAFVPNGTNNVFKPVVVFGESAGYQLVVYNRWGEKVFETNDPNAGWDGKTTDGNAPAGIYAYFITIRQQDGAISESRGTFMLIR